MGDVGAAPALSFDGVSMVFPDGTHALRETTFDVRPGEFVTGTELVIDGGYIAQ